MTTGIIIMCISLTPWGSRATWKPPQYAPGACVGRWQNCYRVRGFRVYVYVVAILDSLVELRLSETVTDMCALHSDSVHDYDSNLYSHIKIVLIYFCGKAAVNQLSVSRSFFCGNRCVRAKFYFILIFNFIFDVYIFGGLGWPHCATFVFSWTSSTPWHNKHFYDTCTQMKNSMFHP